MSSRRRAGLETASYECADALQRLDDYLDRWLTTDELRLVEAHLKVCARCASQFRFETTFVRELRRKLARITLPPAFAVRIRSHLAAASAGGTLLQ